LMLLFLVQVVHGLVEGGPFYHSHVKATGELCTRMT
jgi:hypothetical protein